MKSLDTYAAYLAAKNQADQEEIAAQLAVALYPIWTILQFEDLDTSTPLWLAAALPRIRTAFLQSQRVQAVFTMNVRYASLPLETPLKIKLPDVERPLVSPGAFDMPPMPKDAVVADILDEFPIQHVGESLTIEANYKTKKAMPQPKDEAMHDALVRSSGEAVRQTVDGSRGVSEAVVRRDRKVLGYARVTDSNPCYFCALLASHGLFYSKDAFAKNYPGRRPGRKSDADFIANPDARKDLPPGFLDVAKVHNRCRCTLRPVYSKASGMDAAARYWLNGWNDIYEADPYKSNMEMIQEFRKWHEANPWQGTQFDMYALDGDLAKRKQDLLDAGFAPDSPQVRWVDQSRLNLAA